MPGNEKVNNINLRRGLSASTTLWKWIENVQAGQWANKSYDGSFNRPPQLGKSGLWHSDPTFTGYCPVRGIITRYPRRFRGTVSHRLAIFTGSLQRY